MYPKNRFEYLHTVSFEETNLVGNVYFANFIKWQGLCREMFLANRAKEVIRDIDNNMALITLNCSCNFIGELRAFDKVLICMYLSKLQQNKIKLRFEYFKKEDQQETLIAQGTHEIGCFIRNGDQMIPTEVPNYFEEEIALYD
jgi:enediyne biosynthesis thioesterase